MRAAVSRIARVVFRVLAPDFRSRDELQSDLDERFRLLQARHGRFVAEARMLGAMLQLTPFLLRVRLATRRRRRGGGVVWLELLQVVRGLRRSRGTAALIVLTLTVGISAVTVVFSVFSNLLPRPARAVAAPAEIVNVSFDRTEILPRISAPHFQELADGARDLTRLTSYYNVPVHVSTSGRPAEQLEMELVAEGYFEVLGVRPVTGRTFTPDDFAASALPVVLMREDVAEGYFGNGNPVGSVLTINDHVFEIAGVVPHDYRGPWNGQDTELWAPVALTPRVVPGLDVADPNARFYYHLIGRVPDDESVELVRTRLQFRLDRMVARDSLETPALIPVRDGLVLTQNAWLMRYYEEPIRRLYRTLAGGALLVFAVATVNAGLLLLLRAYRRQRDSTIRLAVGAWKSSLVRMGLIESLSLSVAGGLLAILLTVWVLDALTGLRIFTATPQVIEIFALDRSVLALALGIVGVAGVVAGIAPTLFNLKLAPPLLLRSGTVVGGERTRLTAVSAVLQIALLTPVVLSAALLLRTMSQISAIDVGVESTGLYSAEIDLWPHGIGQDRVGPIYQGILENLRQAGSPRSALTWIPEMSGRRPIVRVATTATVDTSAQFRIATNQISDGYFGTLGIDLVAGRDFAPVEVLSGDKRSQGVVIVNRLAAQRLWGSVNVVGRTLYASDPERVLSVVGVAADVRSITPAAPAEPFIWEPLGQRGFVVSQASILLAIPSELSAAAFRMQTAVSRVIANVPVHHVQSHAERVRRHFTTQINLSRTALGLSIASLALAGIGLFGVIGHSVSSRRGEIAVRMAIGARPSAISRDVFGQVARIATLGIVLGIPGSLIATRALREQLYGLQTLDPVSLIATLVSVVILCAIAAGLPARRAARVPVIEVLRESG